MTILIFTIGATSSIAILCWSVGIEVSNPKLSGMSMSIVNVVGFVFPAILTIVCGKIIDIYTKKGFDPTVVYQKTFIIMVISSVIALVFSLLSTETRGKNIYNK